MQVCQPLCWPVVHPFREESTQAVSREGIEVLLKLAGSTDAKTSEYASGCLLWLSKHEGTARQTKA